MGSRGTALGCQRVWDRAAGSVHALAPPDRSLHPPPLRDPPAAAGGTAGLGAARGMEQPRGSAGPGFSF